MNEKKSTGLAIIGCGYVADFYMATKDKFPDLQILGVYDKDPERLKVFCKYYGLSSFASLEDLLKNENVIVVLNLTNPRSHYEISRLCLDAGKHVYSEKPLAMTYEEAKTLVELAKTKGLKISSAPCNVLGKAAKTLSYAVREKLVGDIKLVYAELDDGLVHKMAYKKWFSITGAPWPYRDEFEIGCALEHAGYFLGWLMEMFGPVKSVTAFSDCVVPEKIDPEPPLQPPDTADVSFGILKFESGVVVRLSLTIVAPHDHSIRLFGDKGLIYLEECWDNDSPVFFQKLVRIRRKTFLSPIKKKVKLPYHVKVNKMKHGSTSMDFLLGVQDLAEAVNTGKDYQLNADFSLHVNEVALALQYANVQGKTYITKSRF
jgi:predicted dehydrogenase